MSDLISKKALIKTILAERDKHPLEVEERYSFGVKVPCRFNQALRGGIRKCLHLVETAPTIDAVEVVRCKECEYQQSCTNAQYLGIEGFCSYGERKEATE